MKNLKRGSQVNLKIVKTAPADSAGTLEKALERNLLDAKHGCPFPLLDFTLGELLGDP